MDERSNLILLKGENKTAEIREIIYDSIQKRYAVTFSSGKQYPYRADSVLWLRNPSRWNPEEFRICRGGKVFSGITEIYDFDGKYLRLVFENGYAKAYETRSLSIGRSCMTDPQRRAVLSYLKALAGINQLKNEDGEVLLQKQYEVLSFVSEEAVLSLYLNPGERKIRKHSETPLIFPFGGNVSQFQAVRNAMQNQLSVIQGPPGTGKTQTILNIIANLLIQGKTVQIVSNNNSAIANVAEKLSASRNNLGFLAATLGNRENKAAFLNRQSGHYPDLRQWYRTQEVQQALLTRVQTESEQIRSCFLKQEALALARQERNDMRTERRHFEAYSKNAQNSDLRVRRKLTAQSVMQTLQLVERSSEAGKTVSFWQKLVFAFRDRVWDWSFWNQPVEEILDGLQSLYYTVRLRELNDQISSLETELAQMNAQKKMVSLTDASMEYLRAVLFDRYGTKAFRQRFDADSFRRCPQEVLKEYPVILSTAFSSQSSLKNAEYDYLIMDEASQVDIATGALALSGAKNAVIVGDLKQLPNVIPKEQREQSDVLFRSYGLSEGYSFGNNSFLKSICTVFPDVPQTLLREHYRCHPRIIGFCNRKFYHNQLIIMTEDLGEPDALSVIQTPPGSHQRGHLNQRQIDVTLEEALPQLGSVNPKQIGIISPYRAQVKALNAALQGREIEADTVHKFQGREKDAIILTTADDTITEFSDDPYLLNVAISRAKKKLCLVVSGNEQPEDSNIRDLIDYIRYYHYSVTESAVKSVFDLLYGQYTRQRLAFLEKNKRVSEYDSENLMYGLLSGLLEKHDSLPYGLILHQSLRMLLNDLTLLTPEECRYALHPNTHVDFLVYNLVSKVPVLAIEVDGFRYHQEGTVQSTRDRQKDTILQKMGIPLLRFPTNGSREAEKLEEFLQSREKKSVL